MTDTAKTTTPEEKMISAIEQRAEEERITRALNDAVERMNKDVDNIRTQLHNDPASLLHVLEWARGHAENAQYGALAREVLHPVEDGKTTLRDALKQQVERCQRALLHDHMTASSTSPFSNATEHARRAAMSRFYLTFSDID